eukprot:Opistho-1_new@8932
MWFSCLTDRTHVRTRDLRGFLRTFDFPRGTNARARDSVLEVFAARYKECNANTIALSADAVFVLVCSTIMLSVDLYSPQIKPKMSKREFVRMHRRLTLAEESVPVGEDMLCAIYDDVYVGGHVVCPAPWQGPQYYHARGNGGDWERTDATRRNSRTFTPTQRRMLVV